MADRAKKAAPKKAAPRRMAGTNKGPAPKAPSAGAWKGPRVPRSLDEVVRTVPDPAGGPPRQVTLVEAAEEALRTSGILADAAARCGVDTDTLREWRRAGARATSDVINGRRKLGDLSDQERVAAEFNERCTRAEREGVLYLAGLAQREAQGGYTVTATKVKTARRRRPDGTEEHVELERVTTTETARPNGTMLRFLLATRDPEHYSQRVEVSGAGGGPIPVEHSATDALLRELGQMAATQEEVRRLLPELDGKTTPDPG